jgi:hypothetical protein
MNMNKNSLKNKKPDNLAQYREERLKRNIKLIKNSIAHIQSLGGIITFSSVSKVTHDLAIGEKGEKGISLSTISKSKIYRALVDEAKGLQRQSDSEDIGNLVKSELKYQLHALRVKNEENKLKIKFLQEEIQRIQKKPSELSSVNQSKRTSKSEQEHKKRFVVFIEELIESGLFFVDEGGLRDVLNKNLYLNRTELELLTNDRYFNK